MDRDERIGRYQREIEAILEAMEQDGVAGGTVGPHGATVGIPNWAETTQDQRFSQKVRTHGYPLGLAKSTRWRRDRLVANLEERVSAMSPEEEAVHDATHEALAWALDAERFLGSFNRVGGDNFPPTTVDSVASHLLIWLRERGYGVIPIGSEKPQPPEVRHAVLYIDIFSGMILDGPTHDLYRQIDTGRLAQASPTHAGTMNALAAQWCTGLRLSTLDEGESPPPSGKVGQYGRYGCVLIESVSDETTAMHDVCCFSYEPRNFGRFIKELIRSRFVRFVHAEVTNVDVVERISGLHTVSRFDLGAELDSDLTKVACTTDVQAALVWGRQHAREITSRRKT